jgi:hypothetical protein
MLWAWEVSEHERIGCATGYVPVVSPWQHVQRRRGVHHLGSRPDLWLRVRFLVACWACHHTTTVLGVVWRRLLAEYAGVGCLTGSYGLNPSRVLTFRCVERCPSGDDPLTVGVDETDCSGKLADGGFGTGALGNKCHVDCANQGVCDYSSGVCRCYEGFYGSNCASLSPII